MDLTQLLLDNPGITLDLLNDKNRVVEDHSFFSFREVINKFGLTTAREALGGLKAAFNATSDPLLDVAYNAMANQGLDFANPLTIEQIDALVAANIFTQDTGDKLKSLGSNRLSLVEQGFGIGTVATQDDFDSANQAIIQRQRRNYLDNLVTQLGSQYNLVRTLVLSDQLVLAKQAWDLASNLVQ